MLHLVVENLDKKEKCRLEFWIKGFFSQIEEILGNFKWVLGLSVKKERSMISDHSLCKYIVLIVYLFSYLLYLE